jgi:hypothetical protein
MTHDSRLVTRSPFLLSKNSIRVITLHMNIVEHICFSSFFFQIRVEGKRFKINYEYTLVRWFYDTYACENHIKCSDYKTNSRIGIRLKMI